MTKKTHIRPADIRGYSRLAVDATLGLTRLVETMHHNIVRVPGPLGKYTEKPTRGITGLVYRSIQGTTRLVGGGIDALLGQLLPLLEREPAASSAGREAVVAALNGVLGDHLAASANPLAIPMQLRQNGRPLALTAQDIAADVSAPSGKILLLVHGLCMNDLQWRRNGHDHGAALAAAGGYTPLYLHYNSGRHVSTNGRALAGMLETLLQAWPVPVEKLVIVGHSMGGLLARSACHYGRLAGHGWLKHLRQLVFLGTPTMARPSSAAATGSMSSSSSAPTPRRWPAWRRSAARASPTCATAASSTRTGRMATALPMPNRKRAKWRCRMGCNALPWLLPCPDKAAIPGRRRCRAMAWCLCRARSGDTRTAAANLIFPRRRNGSPAA